MIRLKCAFVHFAFLAALLSKYFFMTAYFMNVVRNAKMVRMNIALRKDVHLCFCVFFVCENVFVVVVGAES